MAPAVTIARAGFQHAALGAHAHAMSDILDRQHALAGADAGAGRGRKLQMRADTGFGFDKAAIGLQHRDIILRQAKGRIAAASIHAR